MPRESCKNQNCKREGTFSLKWDKDGNLLNQGEYCGLHVPNRVDYYQINAKRCVFVIPKKEFKNKDLMTLKKNEIDFKCWHPAEYYLKGDEKKNRIYCYKHKKENTELYTSINKKCLKCKKGNKSFKKQNEDFSSICEKCFKKLKEEERLLYEDCGNKCISPLCSTDKFGLKRNATWSKIIKYEKQKPVYGNRIYCGKCFKDRTIIKPEDRMKYGSSKFATCKICHILGMDVETKYKVATFPGKEKRREYCFNHSLEGTFSDIRAIKLCKLCKEQTANFGTLKENKMRYCGVCADKINTKNKNNDIINLPYFKRSVCWGDEKNRAESTCDEKANWDELGKQPLSCRDHSLPYFVFNPSRKKCDCSRVAVYRTRFVSQTINPQAYDEYFCEYDKPYNISNRKCEECYCHIPSGDMLCEVCQYSQETGKLLNIIRKEQIVVNYLKKHNINFIHDKIIKGGNNKRRPDILIKRSWGYVIVEIDELQHRRSLYTPDYEYIRTQQIYDDLNKSKLLFVRYNPDTYKPIKGQEVQSQKQRLKRLLFILYHINEKYLVEEISSIYLFFDGYDYTKMFNEMIV